MPNVGRPKKKKPYRLRSFNVADELHERLKRLAFKRQVSMSKLLDIALNAYLKTLDSPSKKRMSTEIDPENPIS